MIKEINTKKNIAYAGHEKVFYFEDKKTKLRGFIAWHNTKLGPATGGTRLYNYPSKKEALSDVLRLSEAMTYKCAITGIPFGGGKNVIIGTRELVNKSFLESYAKIINSFNGKCTTGTDLGISDVDTIYMSKFTPYILKGNGGGKTTSEMAAYGVYLGIKATLNFISPYKKNKDTHISIKGVGKIGYELTKLLYNDNYKITVADIDKKRIKRIKADYPNINIVSHKNIHKINTDVYSPCAMGNEFNFDNIKDLNCKIIAGGANNQFKNVSLIEKIHNMGILYIPDYLINSGGLIQIVDELDESGYNKVRVHKRLKNIANNIKLILKKSKKLNMSPYVITKQIINSKINVN